MCHLFYTEVLTSLTPIFNQKEERTLSMKIVTKILGGAQIPFKISLDPEDIFEEYLSKTLCIFYKGDFRPFGGDSPRFFDELSFDVCQSPDFLLY
jgi:hypothetical protein